ncbi:MAG TPA: hypothetical protein VLK32_03425 [Bacillota bacterium]|nr:hypothetical protein [Bacillota bacterium]
MADFKYKFQMYKHLQASLPAIHAEARRAADEIGIAPELRGKIGLTGAISGCPAPMREDVLQAAERGATEVIPLSRLVEEIREIVKDYYGDEYDVCPVNTCEGGLWVSYDVLFTPPFTGRGAPYRARYMAPYEKHMHHQASYGRPFPPRYKDYLADRGATSGEMGFQGKRMADLDVLIVPLAGGRYENHGIKYWPVPMLLDVDPETSIEIMGDVAAEHAAYLTGFTSLGYDTPGYGYGLKDEDGTPVLLKEIGRLAQGMNLPYVVDNAWGLPFVGTDIREIGADVMVYSMDKASGAATSGLIIGREETMVGIRRALGMHGDRWGTLASYGKAAYVTQDPGKEALLTQVQALKVLRDSPSTLTRPVDQLHELVQEELRHLNPRLRDKLVVSRSYNSGTVEINYERTWQDEGLGFPIFTIEDMYAGSHIIQTSLTAMGIIPTISYDGNIFISPGQGTGDPDGELNPERMRLVLRGLVRVLEIVGKHSGYFA